MNQPIISNSNTIKSTMGRDRSGQQLQVALPICPTKKMDIVNVTLRQYDRYTGNCETVSWEKHLLENDEDLNFIRDFYLEEKNHDEEFYFRYIDKIKQKYNDEARDAYSLAKNLCKQLVAEDLIKTQKLIKNRKQVTQRIKQTLTQHYQNKSEDILRWKTGLKKLFHEMREAIQHILDGGGEKEFFRLEELIKSKMHVTEEFLTQLPQRTQLEIQGKLQNIRIFVSKKTDEYQQYKLEHGDDFHYDEKTIRELSKSSQDDTASCYSDRLTEIRARSKKEKQKEAEKKIEKFYDLNQLKNKWKTTNLDQLKGTIRRVLVKDTLSEAEHIRARAYRLEHKNQKIKEIPKKKQKLTAQERIQQRRDNKLSRSVAEQQRKHTLTREEMKNESLKQEFFNKYNLKSSIGEQFSAAIGYNNLFNS